MHHGAIKFRPFLTVEIGFGVARRAKRDEVRVIAVGFVVIDVVGGEARIRASAARIAARKSVARDDGAADEAKIPRVRKAR